MWWIIRIYGIDLLDQESVYRCSLGDVHDLFRIFKYSSLGQVLIFQISNDLTKICGHLYLNFEP